MIVPRNLAGFTVEQLNGFSAAVQLQIDELRPDMAGDAEKLSAVEALLNERERLNVAIAEALAADGDGGEGDGAEDATADGDATEGEDTTDEEDGEDAADGEGDGAEAAVDDAVAAATLGGGNLPAGSLQVRERREGRGSEIRKFLQTSSGGREGVVQFGVMQRETKHRVNARHTLTKDELDQIRADRSSGEDKTAAGCFCGPDEARTEIVYSGATDRPLSDTLPTITANGDYRFIRQIDIADALDGVTVNGWTCTDQDGVDPSDDSTWKPVFDLDCENEVTSETYGVAAAARFNVQQMIGNPALIDNLEHVMQVAYNQTAELLAYAKLVAASSAYTYALASGAYGASAQLFSAVAWGLELIAQHTRQPIDGYQLVIPAGIHQRILADGQMRGMDDYATWSDIQNRLDALGVSKIVEMLDTTGTPTALNPPGDPADAAVAHDLSQQILLFKPQDFLLGLNPEVNLGVMRSPELALQNKLQWFTESFESVEKVGVDPSLAITVDLCQSGVRPALAEGETCVTED